MFRSFFCALALLTTTICFAEGLRAPAVPLVVHDPYFSIWSQGDGLADRFTTHWTGRVQCLLSLIKIDGQNFAVMSKDSKLDVPAMKQTGLQILPTRTIYTFADAGVELTLTFTTPSVMDGDLMAFSRPVTYLTWTVRSIDGKKHAVKLYYDNSAEICVDAPSQAVCAKRLETEKLNILRFGSADQNVLCRPGDDLRIEWGYAFLAVCKNSGGVLRIAEDQAARQTFVNEGTVVSEDDADFPRKCNDRWPVVSCVFDLPEVAADAQSRTVLIGYDDEYCLEFLNQKLRPYWRKDGMEAKEMLDWAADDYEAACKRCEAFDAKLISACEAKGGKNYADLCAIAYRQAVGAHKLAVLPNGEPLYVSKENFSGGMGATVDVVYPAAPLFMYLNNTLLKATLTPAMDYAKSGRWPWPYAPHDPGRYPLLNGQYYGGGEKTEANQMPVEETGNMLILLYVASKNDGNTEYADRYGKIIQRWAEYLLSKGLDPENQLCTDDFAGHLAHNCNLSIKAIIALACYSELCKMQGRDEEAKKYRAVAEDYAKQWEEMAKTGDHYRLAFDQEDSWSQKYNLVWDKLLDLNLFPRSVVEAELKYYPQVTKEFGLPLDNRADYTKLDWEVWTATMANSREQFDALMAPVYRFVNATEPRTPMTDWYFSSDAKRRGFTARSVVGGVFIKLLEK